VDVVADNPSTKPVAKPKRIVRKIATPSIKMALKGEFKGDKKLLSAKEQHQLYSKADEVEPFTKEQLEEKWQAFMPRLEDSPNLKSTLSRVPKLEEDYSLLLEIDNTIQNDIIATIKPELVSFLRKELRNSKIVINTVVTDIVREKVIYTDIEKYQEMASKNPNLALLKRSLNLEF
jgi:hypothetical protein